MPDEVYGLWEGDELLGLYSSLKSAMTAGDAQTREWTVNSLGAYECYHHLIISKYALNA